MTNEYEFGVRFVVPDNVERDNVRDILQEFFGDIEQTDRFVKARVETEDSISMDEHEKEDFMQLLEYVERGDLDAAVSVIEELQEDE